MLRDSRAQIPPQQLLDPSVPAWSHSIPTPRVKLEAVCTPSGTSLFTCPARAGDGWRPHRGTGSCPSSHLPWHAPPTAIAHPVPPSPPCQAGGVLPAPAPWRPRRPRPGLSGEAGPTDADADANANANASVSGSTTAAPTPELEREGEGASPPLSLTFRSRETPGRSGSAMATPARREPRDNPPTAGGAVAWRRVASRGRGEGRRGRAKPSVSESQVLPSEALQGSIGFGSRLPRTAGTTRARSLRPRRRFSWCYRPPGRPGGIGGRQELAFVLSSPGPAGVRRCELRSGRLVSACGFWDRTRIKCESVCLIFRNSFPSSPQISLDFPQAQSSEQLFPSPILHRLDWVPPPE